MNLQSFSIFVMPGRSLSSVVPYSRMHLISARALDKKISLRKISLQGIETRISSVYACSPDLPAVNNTGLYNVLWHRGIVGRLPNTVKPRFSVAVCNLSVYKSPFAVPVSITTRLHSVGKFCKAKLFVKGLGERIKANVCLLVCLCVSLLVCISRKNYIYCCTAIYIVRISRKNYIYCCTAIYMYFKKKLYILF
jgi:hypothetical protein